MPLVINSFGGGDTHTNTHTHTHTYRCPPKSLLRNQTCTGQWPVCAWFKQMCDHRPTDMTIIICI